MSKPLQRPTRAATPSRPVGVGRPGNGMRPPTGKRVPNGRRPPNGKGPLIGGQKWDWRNFDRRWLVFIPVFFIVLLAAMYASIACNMAEPADIILGKKGLEILDRDGKVIYTIGDEPGS